MNITRISAAEATRQIKKSKIDDVFEEVINRMIFASNHGQAIIYDIALEQYVRDQLVANGFTVSPTYNSNYNVTWYLGTDINLASDMNRATRNCISINTHEILKLLWDELFNTVTNNKTELWYTIRICKYFPVKAMDNIVQDFVDQGYKVSMIVRYYGAYNYDKSCSECTKNQYTKILVYRISFNA